MTNLKKIAGFDISKAFFDVCISNNDQRKVYRFSADKQGFSSVAKLLCSDMWCVMEATGPYYLKLACYLHGAGFKVSVVNPLVIKRFSQMRLLRAKTDKADAQMIAAYGQTEALMLWDPPSASDIKLQQLEALRKQLQKHYSAICCQQEAFAASGLMAKDIKQKLNQIRATLQRQIAAIEKQMESIVGEQNGEMLTNITSVKGVGKKTAILLIVLSKGFKKFENYKQLSAYLGLSPRIYESGTSVKGRSKICKMGMSRIRAMLYVCAWSAKKWNTACRDLYDRLVSVGKSKRLALIAVANKLIKQVFAIATSNTKFDNNYLHKTCF